MADLTGEVLYQTSGQGDAAATYTSGLTARVRYQSVGDGSITSPPLEGGFRVTLVHPNGTSVAVIENAAVQSVGIELNQWENWSFTVPISDPKAIFLLGIDHRMHEAQIWYGDILLSWGPMTRPQVDNGVVSVTGVGAAWILSRRHIGKANRPNMLANPSFEEGFWHWTYIRTAHPFTFQPIPAYEVRVVGPGREGQTSQALEMNSDLRPYVTPGSSIGTGNIGTHTVVSGNTLWGIATTYYGSGKHWPIIYNANQAAIQARAVQAGLWNPKNPGHWIFPGTVLTIPRLTASEAQPVPADENPLRWGDTHAFQEFTVNGGVRGATFTLTGWLKIPSQYLVNWGGSVGVVLARFQTDYKTSNHFTRNGMANDWGGYRGLYTEPIEVVYTKVGEGHPLDTWVRHEVSITVPPGATQILHARVSGVSGKVYWDSMSLTQDLAFENFGTDQATIIANLVAHAQDPAFDKNSAYIATSTPNTGVIKDLVSLHSEHANIWDLIMDHTQYDDGIDVSTQYTATRRTLVTHYPFKGRTRVPLHLRLKRNIATYSWAFDGETAASSTIVLGTGEGSDREEAVAMQPTVFASGSILETVHAVGPEVPVDRLQEAANEHAGVSRNPEILTINTYPHDPSQVERRLIGYLDVGDLVPVSIQDGPVFDGNGNFVRYNLDINDTYRIVSITINGDSTMSLTLNHRTFGNAG